MNHIVNNMITLILVFIGLIIMPITFSFYANSLNNEMKIRNECNEFIDKVADKGSVNQDDLRQINLSLNTHGYVLDVDVQRLISAPLVDDDNNLKSNFIKDDVLPQIQNGTSNIEEVIYNKNDEVRIVVKEIGYSQTRRLLFAILRIDRGAFEYTMATSIR